MPAAGVLRIERTCSCFVNSGAGQMNKGGQGHASLACNRCPGQLGAETFHGEHPVQQAALTGPPRSQLLPGWLLTQQWAPTVRQPSGAPEPLEANTSLGRCSTSSERGPYDVSPPAGPTVSNEIQPSQHGPKPLGTHPQYPRLAFFPNIPDGNCSKVFYLLY